MAKIPITVTKLLREKRTFNNSNQFIESFLIQINDKCQKWDLSYLSDRKHLIKFRNEINETLGFTLIAKNLKCSVEQAELISNYQETEDICNNCNQKNKICFDCIYTCQSPLEQKLFVALKNEDINPKLQWRIQKDGTGYSKDIPVDKNTILTVPDFYLESYGKKICIYADGHTYHERTENQALRDRRIDRNLQNLGFVCLRFTGKEIRERMDNVVETIKKTLKNKS